MKISYLYILRSVAVKPCVHMLKRNTMALQSRICFFYCQLKIFHLYETSDLSVLVWLLIIVYYFCYSINRLYF